MNHRLFRQKAFLPRVKAGVDDSKGFSEVSITHLDIELSI